MIWSAYAAASLWAELIEVTGKSIIVPVLIALITAFFASPLLNALIARRLGKRLGEKVDKVVGQVTNGDTAESPKLRTDLDWSIANGVEILAQLDALRRDFSGFRDEVRGRFDRDDRDAAEEREIRRRIEARVGALERPA